MEKELVTKLVGSKSSRITLSPNSTGMQWHSCVLRTFGTVFANMDL